MPNPYGRPHTGHNVNCVECGVPNYVPMWKINIGKGKFCSRECYYKNKSIQMTGKGNHRYKDGRTRLSRNLYLTSEWRTLRKSIYQRDNYECVICGNHGGRIHAHHIVEVGLCENPFDMDNIITVCHSCHGKIHRRNN